MGTAMAYISDSDIENRLGTETLLHLTDNDGDGVADPAVLADARLAAEGEVNSYLAQRYQVPVDASQDAELAGLLAARTLDLAEHRLRLRRPPVAQDILDQRDQTLTWLRQVADGSAQLAGATRLASGSTPGLLADSTGAPRRLTVDELGDY
jgi:phage gp36-like protein